MEPENSRSQTILMRKMMECDFHIGRADENIIQENRSILVGFRHKVPIFNLEFSIQALQSFLKFYEGLSSLNSKVLFITEVPEHKYLVKLFAEKHGHFHLTDKWPNGLFTNWNKTRKRMDNYESWLVEKGYTGKKAARLKSKFLEKYGGILHMKKLPEAVVLLGVSKDDMNYILSEATITGVPVTGLTNFDVNPMEFLYPVPGNDESPATAAFMLAMMEKSFSRGKKLRADMLQNAKIRKSRKKRK